MVCLAFVNLSNNLPSDLQIYFQDDEQGHMLRYLHDSYHLSMGMLESYFPGDVSRQMGTTSPKAKAFSKSSHCDSSLWWCTIWWSMWAFLWVGRPFELQFESCFNGKTCPVKLTKVRQAHSAAFMGLFLVMLINQTDILQSHPNIIGAYWSLIILSLFVICLITSLSILLYVKCFWLVLSLSFLVNYSLGGNC